ncbi:HdeD family acid-resistance protein [Streptomyces misionensis]|uniref:HdeD family acid-resistance protein n=1 Tax=Streptomyces misionensis TaxID=67331 RepID=A0A5C6IRR4_9ACTN|nr:DUF308 domain-containing protein [Streptomyces misionensis]TWV31273.1 HdeD family acid-resistance protein [Streptomyces misionensis]
MTTSRDTSPQGPDRPSPGPEQDPGGAAGTAAPTEAAPDPARALGRLGGSWPWSLGTALVSLVPGILILVWPQETLHVLAVILGLYLLATGVFRFVAAFGRAESGERLAGLLVALLYVLAGVLCLRNPLQTITALSLIVGVVWLVSGILVLYAALVAEDLPHRGFVIGVAVIAVLAGVVVLALPAPSARVLTRLLGLWLVLLGVCEAVVAFAWRAALRGAAARAPAPRPPFTRPR